MTCLRAKLIALLPLLLCGAVVANVAVPDSLYGQPVDPPRYNVRSWQTDEGLPQNSVWAIAHTPDGHLWVGPPGGVARFDGVRLTLPGGPAAPYLKQGWIVALCVSRDGSLWIASENNGLTRLKDGVFTQFKETDGLPGSQVQCLLESEDGSLWIGGLSGLARVKEGKFKTLRDTTRLGNNYVKPLIES